MDRQGKEAVKEVLAEFFGDRYDPENGWKTKRAVFEATVTEQLKALNEKISKHNEQMIEHLERSSTNDLLLNELSNWKKTVTRALWTLYGAVITTIGLMLLTFFS